MNLADKLHKRTVLMAKLAEINEDLESSNEIRDWIQSILREEISPDIYVFTGKSPFLGTTNDINYRVGINHTGRRTNSYANSVEEVLSGLQEEMPRIKE